MLSRSGREKHENAKLVNDEIVLKPRVGHRKRRRGLPERLRRQKLLLLRGSVLQPRRKPSEMRNGGM